MPKSPLTLLEGSRVDLNTDYRDALPINMYAVMRKILGADGYLLCFPGLTEIATVPGVDRAGLYNERFNEHYRVSGTKLIQLRSNGTVDELGAISGTKQASMPYSFNTQGIIADGKMWLYSPTDGLVQVTDADLGSPIDGVWVDGYYFLTDGEFIYHTNISNEMDIDPLKYDTAQFSPDATLAVGKTQDNKVLVFGRYSIEYFENIAQVNFAFTRLSQRAQKIGIVATHAKCELGDSFFICGGRKEESLGIHKVGIGQSQKISTREIDKILAQYTEPQLVNMRMEGRTEDDVSFLYVHLPNETLCFNLTIASVSLTAAWSILQTAGCTGYRGINGAFDSSRGYWVYGDKFEGKVGKLDNTVFTHYGVRQEWYLYTPLINIEKQSIDELEIETIPGNTPYDDATVAVSLTYDGLVYSMEWWEMYGQPLDRSKRFILRRLGSVESWVGFRFRGYTKSRMAFAMISIEHG